MLAYWLRHAGVTQDSIVPIYMHHNLEFVISYIAILKAGGAYLPLELGYPAEMMDRVLSETSPVVVLTMGEHVSSLPSEYNLQPMDAGWEDKVFMSKEMIGALTPVTTQIDSLAYAVYSSGTTGVPKGILCPHRGACMSYAYRQHTTPYHEDGSDREAANVFFVWEMLRPLLRGAVLVVIPDHVIFDPLLLTQFLNDNKITRMLFTPSLLEAVLGSPVLSKERVNDGFQHFRVLILCGEVVTVDLRNRILAINNNIELSNLYSISECHDVCAINLAKTNNRTDSKYCSTGQPIPGVEVMIIDEGDKDDDEDSTTAFKLAPRGMPGEVYVSGPTLARGYMLRPDLNDKRFPPRPSTIPSEPNLLFPGQDGPEMYTRIYKTGDWGRLLPDGGLEICGRHDSMQKIRGYSVDRLAVETQLLLVPGVSSGVVTVVGDEGTDKHLAAFVVFDIPAYSGPGWKKIAAKRTRELLKAKMMHYAVPSFIIPVDELPTHKISGKLDTKALPNSLPELIKFITAQELLDAPPSIVANESTEVDTEVHELVSKVWAEVLELPLAVIDPEDSFFDQGGHSLRAAHLVAVLSKQLNRTIPVGALMQYPTIKLLTTYLEGESGKVSDTRLSLAELEEELQGMTMGTNFDLLLRAYWRGVMLHARSTSNSSSKLDGERVLLTGATGFFGAYLLRELLSGTSVRTVYCLTRPTANKTVMERVIQNMKRYRIWEEKWESRIECIEGDTSLTDFGLGTEDYSYLCTSTDRVVHAAAQVNLIYPYTALRRANVVATRNVIVFAQESKVKPLTYVSTNSVFHHGTVGAKEDADLTEELALLRDGYGQSKCVAELLVKRAAQAGLPVTIFRPGNLAGPDPRKAIQTPINEKDKEHSNPIEASGWNSLDSNWLYIAGCVVLGAAPVVPEWKCELTPVDFSAASVIGAMVNTSALDTHKSFNVVNPYSMRFQVVFDTLRGSGMAIEALSFEAWKERLSTEQSSVGGVLASLWNLVEPMRNAVDLYTADVSSTYDTTHLLATNAKNNINNGAYPPVDVELIREYCAHWVDSGALPKPMQPISRPLLGLTAIVTGSSGGLGAAIARHFAEAGANVCLAARRKERIEALASELSRRYGVTCIAVPTDVTKRDQCKAMVATAIKTIPGCTGIDYIVNNAGVMCYTFMKNLNEDQWEQQVDINCKGVLNGVGAVLSGMLERGRGHIINISSDAGRKVFPGLAVYSASKHFVEAVSQGLRLETAGSGIKVTCIQPGDIRTDLSLQTTDEEARAEFAQPSQDRNVWLDPADVARTVVWVASQPDHVAINEVLVEPRAAPA